MDGLNAIAGPSPDASAKCTDRRIYDPKPEGWEPASDPIQNQDLMSHQDRFSNNGTEPSGSGESDDDDDRLQKKNENVAHPQDGIKLKKP